MDALFFSSSPFSYYSFPHSTLTGPFATFSIHRPYGGLTFRFPFLTDIYNCGLPRTTIEHCLVSLDWFWTHALPIYL